MGTRDHLQNETQKRDRTKIRPTFTLTHFSKPKSLHKSISSCRRYHSIAASPLVFGAGQFCSFIRLQLSAPENDTRLMMYDIQASPFHVVASAAGVTLGWIEYFRFKRIKKAFFPQIFIYSGIDCSFVSMLLPCFAFLHFNSVILGIFPAQQGLLNLWDIAAMTQTWQQVFVRSFWKKKVEPASLLGVLNKDSRGKMHIFALF